MKAQIILLRQKLVKPFFTNHQTVTENAQIILTLTWNNLTGFGTGLLPRQATDQFESFQARMDVYSDILKEATPFQLENLMSKIESVSPSSTLEHQAFDMALYDLLGKALNVPLFKFWGLEDLQLAATGISVSATDAEENFWEEVEPLLEFPILKIKMKTHSDPGIIQKLRRKYSGRIWIDGNGSWDLDTTLQLLPYFENLGVELVEQPLPFGQMVRLKQNKKTSQLMIIADEDCTDTQSILNLQGAVDGVAIKLHKCGGLGKAKKMIDLAKALRMKVMLGCRTESVLGPTAMSQLGGLADYLDLDGAIEIAHDAFDGLKIEKGILQRPTVVGLGVTLHE